MVIDLKKQFKIDILTELRSKHEKKDVPPQQQAPPPAAPAPPKGASEAGFCPECGTKLEENATFCPECGTKL